MEQKLSEKEVVRLVAEVSKMDAERQQMLDKAQVAQILRDLDLSEDMLDEAMIRLEQSRAEEKRKKSQMQIGMIGVVLAVVSLVTIFGVNMTHNNELAAITASQTRIASQSAPTADVNVVNAGGGMIEAHVTLQNVPQGQRIPMRAKWIDPTGVVFHENSWQTKPAQGSTWDTHAKCDITGGAAKGNWLVKFFVGDREVASKPFVVN